MQENSPEIKQFIREHSNLFWYTPEDQKENISHEFLVETILNYGDLDTIKKLFKIAGRNYIGEIFKNTINISPRRSGNYFDLTLNYFTLYFKKHAPSNTQ
jgi:hypothetical protein